MHSFKECKRPRSSIELRKMPRLLSKRGLQNMPECSFPCDSAVLQKAGRRGLKVGKLDGRPTPDSPELRGAFFRDLRPNIT